ncbi:MAG: type 1 glutamine amidotransferase [bacterium]|nr:MAG: type 1 glutamine amidotransferase [bacterium]
MLIILKHVPHEGPGLLAEMMEGRGVPHRSIEIFEEGVPLSAAGFTGIVSMGGPMSVNDGHEGIEREKALLLEAIQRDLPVLGVCLGAQILASALGARVYPGEHPEVGWGEVELTPEGMDDPLFSGVEKVLPVLHWHQETFDLPEGALRLASSRLYPNQAFRWGKKAYGFQFHLEVDEEMVQEWTQREQAGGEGLTPDTAALEGRVRTCLGPVRFAGSMVFGRFLDLVVGRRSG